MTDGKDSGRRLPNWISSFTRLTSGLETPEIFRKWAAISVIASVLERKVWSKSKGMYLYPNQYIVLVGPPGTGKSNIISFSERLMRQVTDIFVAPSSVTSASLIDTMQLAQRKILQPYFYQFNSVQVLSSEFQNFLPAYEASFMGIMTKLYDCELYEERRRTGKVQHIKIDSPQLSMLAGTTPSYLNTFLPEGAWDQGFTSRTIFVFAETNGTYVNIFEDASDAEYLKAIHDDLLHDLKLISSVSGQALWTEEAQLEMTAWDIKGRKPVPSHGRLTHYNSRRTVHILKLAIVASLARGQSLSVTKEDFETAKSWLFEAEELMPDIFKNMSITSEARAMEDARYYLKQLHGKLNGSAVPEHFLISFLKDRIPSHSLTKVIDTMVRSKMIDQSVINGLLHYKPNDR
jgi:Protein of unknown function (DUF3987)